MTQHEQIGRYKVHGILGKGAMGSVYKAFDPNLDRWVAIKTMRTGREANSEAYEEFKKRFFQESRVYGRLHHPNIVSVFDCGEHEDEPFLVMELIDGQSLDHFIRKNYESRLAHFIDLLSQVASGLDYAHDEGICHRDIKPGNILVAQTRRGDFMPKIVDFGLAKLRDSKLTQTGFFLGTPSYSSPEQIAAADVGPAADIYALGTVAYEILTGKLPFDADSMHAILYQIVNVPPKIDLTAFESFLNTRALREVFQKVLSKSPGERFETASEFVAALDPLVSPHAQLKTVKLTPRPTGPKEEQSNETLLNSKSSPASPGLITVVERTRAQFRQAAEARHLALMKKALDELLRLNADARDEAGQMRAMESQINDQDAERRKKQTAQARKRFQKAVLERDLNAARQTLLELQIHASDVSREVVQLGSLETSIEQEEEDRKKEKARQKRVDELRAAFKESLASRNLDACERAVSQLRDLEDPATDEEAEVEAARRAIAEETRQYVQKKRREFRNALEKEQLTSCRIILADLENVDPENVTEEREALIYLEKEVKERQALELKEKLLQSTLVAFSNAFKNCDTELCRLILDKLTDLGEDITDQLAAVTLLEEQLQQQREEEERAARVKQGRIEFQMKLKQREFKAAQVCLDRLASDLEDIGPEQDALRAAKKQDHEERENRLREDMIAKLRQKFRDELKRRNLNSCQYYLDELKALDADVSEPLEALAGIDRQVQFAERKFEVGLKTQNPMLCRQYLKTLKDQGVDTHAHTRKLKAMEEELKDPETLRHSIEAERLRQKMIRQFRHQYQEALEQKNGQACAYYLRELEQLHVDVEQERETLQQQNLI